MPQLYPQSVFCFADSVDMDIITYCVNGVNENFSRSSVRSEDANGIFFHKFQRGSHSVRSFSVKPALPALVRKIERMSMLPAVFTVLFLLTLILIPFFYALFFAPTLNGITFEHDVTVDAAAYEYMFPHEQELFSASEMGAVSVAPYASLVTFAKHKVRRGDTLSGIAVRSGLRSIGTLVSVNGIDNARRLTAGQMLIIPSTDGIYYTVARGETISGIAKKYGTAVTSLVDANDLPDSVLSVGQKLFIPGASMPSFELRKAMGELFMYPIRGRLTSSFGYRKDPFTGRKSFHSGIDLAAPIGTPVKATLDGTVAESGVNRIFGNYIIIRHDRGYQSLYGHMHKLYAKRGQKITQGAVIGIVGNTGYSTGPHLHLSIYKHGKMIDPFSVLKN